MSTESEDDTEREKITDWADLVYTRRGLRAHLAPHQQMPGIAMKRVLCHRTPPLFENWLGTGTQDEYERAAGLDLCRACLERARTRRRA